MYKAVQEDTETGVLLTSDSSQKNGFSFINDNGAVLRGQFKSKRCLSESILKKPKNYTLTEKTKPSFVFGQREPVTSELM
uniref:Uncharacterized protein n=1 Tax=Pyxicephalus adspersus TaxID=30357 RepID=A0AAV3A3Y1_PYXAD|nr:TPA: hypothetical protein GDO54_014974 [Pyxicephalus adspersus]